jgi:hypothetical protein
VDRVRRRANSSYHALGRLLWPRWGADELADVTLPGVNEAQEDDLGAPLFRGIRHGDGLFVDIPSNIQCASVTQSRPPNRGWSCMWQLSIGIGQTRVSGNEQHNSQSGGGAGERGAADHAVGV